MPPGYRLAIDQAKFGVRLVLRLADEVDAQSGGARPRDSVALGHAQQQLAQRRLANVQFNLGAYHQLVFTMVIRQHFRHGKLWQNLIGLDAQSKIGA